MSISGINNYNRQNYSVTANVNQTNSTAKAAQSSKTEASFASNLKKTSRSDINSSTQQYLADLQKRNPEINIMQGGQNTGLTSNGNSKTDVMIAPSILKQMASDPEAAMKYEKMLADIPALNKWADSMIRAMTGSEVKYRQVWIDDDGNMGSFCVTGPSDETKKEQQEKIKERKEKQQELLERIKTEGKNPLEIAYMKNIMQLLS